MRKSISPSLVAWSILAGPVFGIGAYIFVQATKRTRIHSAVGWRRVAWCAVVFPTIGVLAIRFPQLLGNGKGLAQAGYDSDLSLALAATLLLLRLVVIAGALRAGAAGGLLTPGLSIGGLLGIILGSAWNYAWPGGPLGAFAVVGSAAFLASSMKMPLTAIVLIVEFTRVSDSFLVPISFAVAGSAAMFHLCTQYSVRRTTTRRTAAPSSSAPETVPIPVSE